MSTASASSAESQKLSVQKVAKQILLLEVQAAELRALRSNRAVYQDNCGILFRTPREVVQQDTAAKLKKAKAEQSQLTK